MWLLTSAAASIVMEPDLGSSGVLDRMDLLGNILQRIFIFFLHPTEIPRQGSSYSEHILEWRFAFAVFGAFEQMAGVEGLSSRGDFHGL